MDIEKNSVEKARAVAERIAAGWGLTPEETDQLLGDSDIEQISYTLGIYKALRLLFPTEEQSLAWPSKPNRAFDGESAIDLMLSGRIAEVRRYLDGQCQ